MNAMENRAGRTGKVLLEAFSTRRRRRAISVGCLAVAMACVALAVLAATSSALRRDRGTVELLRADGISADAPVVGLRETGTGRVRDIEVIVQLPQQAGTRRVGFDNERLPNPVVGVGELVEVVYSSSDPSVVVPAREVTQESRLRADRQGFIAAWLMLAASLIPAAVSIVLWRRAGQPG